MKCVILAAGVSKRLRPLTSDRPKCLLKVGGIPLLQRTVEHVLQSGVREIGIVTGFGEKKIQSLVSRKIGTGVCSIIRNRRFRSTNNAYSLLTAKSFVANSPFLLLDSDLLFGPRMLKSFLNVQRRPNRIAVRVTGQHDEEEIRVKINRWDHVEQIGKQVPLRESYGESIGMEVFSADAAAHLFEVLEKRMTAGTGKTEFYEAAFQEMVDSRTRIWAVDIGNQPVIEIDTREDLARAERLAAMFNHA